MKRIKAENEEIMKYLKNEKGKKISFKKLTKLFTSIGSLCSALEPLMMIFDLVSMFLPQSDSAELSYMKTHFSIVENKLDTVLNNQEKIIAGIKLVDMTAHLDTASLNSLYDDTQRVKNRFNGAGMTQEMEHEVKALKNRFDQVGIKNLVEKLIYSILEPEKFLANSGSNLLELYQTNNDNNCANTIEFGVKVIELMRKSRLVLQFYSYTVNVKVDIDWPKTLKEVADKVYERVSDCMKNAVSHVNGKLERYLKCM